MIQILVPGCPHNNNLDKKTISINKLISCYYLKYCNDLKASC